MHFKTAPFIALLATLAGCASMTPTVETKTSYVILDVKLNGQATQSQLVNTIKQSLQENVSSMRVNEGLPPNPLPEKAQRFDSRGNCSGEILHASTYDTLQDVESNAYNICLVPYVGGYQVDFIATFTKASGVISINSIGASLARKLVGDSSQLTPRIINSLINSIQSTGAKVAVAETYPDDMMDQKGPLASLPRLTTTH